MTSGVLVLLAAVATNVYVFAKPPAIVLPPVWKCSGFWLPATNHCYAGDVSKCSNPSFCFVFQLGGCYNCSDLVKANTPTPFPTPPVSTPMPALI